MGVLSKNFTSLYINIIIICLLALSLAGTIVVFNADTSSSSYVIAIDNSGSMRTMDILPDRLSAAKSSAKKFIEFLPIGTRVGIISFAGNAEIVKEMDSSKIEAKAGIDSIDFSELEGTNIFNTMTISKQVLEGADEKAVVLISDGQVNIGEISQAISYASSNNIVINTVAIGTAAGGVTGLGAISKMDEDSLRALAFNSGGKFFSAENSEELDASFDSIVERTEKEVSVNISAYLVIAALFLVLLNWILFNLRFRTIP